MSMISYQHQTNKVSFIGKTNPTQNYYKYNILLLPPTAPATAAATPTAAAAAARTRPTGRLARIAT